MRYRSFDRHTWSTAAASAWWKSLAPEPKRLLTHGLALALVACAAATVFFAGATGAGPTFLLSNAVVAISASVGGFWAGAVAALASLLAARLMSQVGPTSSVLFVLEALLISLLVARMTLSVQKQRRQVKAAEARIDELELLVRHGRAIDVAFGRLEEVSADAALVILDLEGRITDWRPSALRLYRCTDDTLGMSGAALFSPAIGVEDFKRLLEEASRNAVARHGGRHCRADGTEFDADVEIRPLAEHGCDGFTMLICDQTRRQQWQAFAGAAEDERTILREEAALTQHQLATLRSVTDPTLNALPSSHLLAALLDRLREAVDAGGVALVRFDGFEGDVVTAAGGLQPHSSVQRRLSGARELADGRILLIQNDPPRVAELTAVGWPDTVSSLIAVSVLSGGRLEGAIEVVDVRGRRSTEWEIALIQVVAGRIGLLIAQREHLLPRHSTTTRPGRSSSERFVARNP
jgi:PAS domain-containing protein